MIEFFSMQLPMTPEAPPPSHAAQLPTTVQLFSVLYSAPPPKPSKPLAAFPVTTQLLRMPALAPPPESAELPLTVQQLSVLPHAPQPNIQVQLRMSAQLFSVPP